MALLVTNRTEWLVAPLGAAKIGAVTAAISTFSTPRELGWMLEHCGARVLVTLRRQRPPIGKTQIGCDQKWRIA